MYLSLYKFVAEILAVPWKNSGEFRPMAFAHRGDKLDIKWSKALYWGTVWWGGGWWGRDLSNLRSWEAGLSNLRIRGRIQPKIDSRSMPDEISIQPKQQNYIETVLSQWGPDFLGGRPPKFSRLRRNIIIIMEMKPSINGKFPCSSPLFSEGWARKWRNKGLMIVGGGTLHKNRCVLTWNCRLSRSTFTGRSRDKEAAENIKYSNQTQQKLIRRILVVLSSSRQFSASLKRFWTT